MFNEIEMAALEKALNAINNVRLIPFHNQIQVDELAQALDVVGILGLVHHSEDGCDDETFAALTA
jgi:hypothetical protein